MPQKHRHACYTNSLVTRTVAPPDGVPGGCLDKLICCFDRIWETYLPIAFQITSNYAVEFIII